MIDFRINLHKRIIVLILGIIGFYFGFIPVSLLVNIVSGQLGIQSIENPGSIQYAHTILFGVIRFAFLFLAIYLAFVKIKPSLIPRSKINRKRLAIGVIVFLFLLLAIPNGFFMGKQIQGQCSFRSVSDEQNMASTTSSSIRSESECLEICRGSPSLGASYYSECKFKGAFGQSNWTVTPAELQKPGYILR